MEFDIVNIYLIRKLVHDRCSFYIYIYQHKVEFAYDEKEIEHWLIFGT